MRVELRVVPIEGVDFLDAGVADEQRGFVGGEAAPISEGAAGGLKAFHAEDGLKFSVADLGPVVAFLVIEDSVEIDVAAVARPSRIGHENVGERGPFLAS